MSGIKGKSGVYLRKKPAWNKGKAGFMKGKKFSKEHRLKIAESLKGNKNGFKEIKQTIEDKKRLAKVIRFRNKMSVLSYYSKGLMECNCCGITDIEKLTIDHINGGGLSHRKNIFGFNCAGSPFHFWLINNGFPEGYQVLCRSCNCSKGNSSQCKIIHNN